MGKPEIKPPSSSTPWSHLRLNDVVISGGGRVARICVLASLATLLSSACKDDPAEEKKSENRAAEILEDESGELLAAAMKEHPPSADERALVAYFWLSMAEADTQGSYNAELVRIGIIKEIKALSAHYPSVFENDSAFGESTQGLIRSKDDFKCDNGCNPAADLLGKSHTALLSKGIGKMVDVKRTKAGARAWANYKASIAGSDLSAATANQLAGHLTAEDGIAVAEYVGTAISAGTNLANAAGLAGTATLVAEGVATTLGAVALAATLTIEGVKIGSLVGECLAWKQANCDLCGNGVVDAFAGEGCDGFSCPTDEIDCYDSDFCTIDKLVGMAGDCSARCSNEKIAACEDGDFCCPPGCTIDNDVDCKTECGDGLAEGGEECDGDDLRDKECSSFSRYTAGRISCTDKCKLDKSLCTTCGNAVIEGDEFCDVAEFKESISCADFPQHTAGELSCNSECTNYDFSRCDCNISCGHGETAHCGSNGSMTCCNDSRPVFCEQPGGYGGCHRPGTDCSSLQECTSVQHGTRWVQCTPGRTLHCGEKNAACCAMGEDFCDVAGPTGVCWGGAEWDQVDCSTIQECNGQWRACTVGWTFNCGQHQQMCCPTAGSTFCDVPGAPGGCWNSGTDCSTVQECNGQWLACPVGKTLHCGQHQQTCCPTTGATFCDVPGPPSGCWDGEADCSTIYQCNGRWGVCPRGKRPFCFESEGNWYGGCITPSD